MSGSQDTFLPLLIRWLLGQLRSAETLDTVVGQFEYLISEAQHHNIAELCANIGQSIFRKAMQEPSDPLVKLCMRLCNSLFLITIKCDSSLSSRSANIHDYVFRHCIDTLESGSSAGTIVGTTIQGTVISENIPVERISLLASEMYGSGLISIAQLFDLLRHAHTSLAPTEARVTGLCVLLEAHGSSFKTEPWKTKIVAMLDEARECNLKEYLTTRLKSAGSLFPGTQVQDTKIALNLNDGTKLHIKIPQPLPHLATVVNNDSSPHLRPLVDVNPDIPTPIDVQAKPEELPLSLVNLRIAPNDVQANRADQNPDDHSSNAHEPEPAAPPTTNTIHGEIGQEATSPSSQHHDEPVPREISEMPPDEWQAQVGCKVQGLLDVLPTGDFDLISNQIIASMNGWGPEDDGRTMEQIAKLMVETAQRNEENSEVYARLCRKMAESTLPGVQDGSSQYSNSQPAIDGRLFFEYLLGWCREGFERGQNIDKVPTQFSSRSGRRNALATAKHQYLGLIRFVGELSNVQILDEPTTHTYVEILFRRTTELGELDVEFLCKLLATIGRRFDGSAAQGRMDSYLKQVHAMRGRSGMQSNTWFMLQDLIDLRAQHWQTLSQAQVNQGKRRRKITIKLGHHGLPTAAEGGSVRKRQKRISLERKAESIEDTPPLAST